MFALLPKIGLVALLVLNAAAPTEAPKKPTEVAAPNKASGGSKKHPTKPKAGPKAPKAPKKPVSKPGKKIGKKPSAKSEDTEIIEHLEFLMLFGLLKDYDLFDEDPK